MSSLGDRYKAAEQKAELEKRKRRMKARKEAQREAAINDGRCFAVGRIICARFPELRKYQPQYGDAESDAIHDDLVAIVDLLSNDRKLLEWIRAKTLNGKSRHPDPQDPL